MILWLIAVLWAITGTVPGDVRCDGTDSPGETTDPARPAARSRGPPWPTAPVAG